jgi:hypothetical protein
VAWKGTAGSVAEHADPVPNPLIAGDRRGRGWRRPRCPVTALGRGPCPESAPRLFVLLGQHPWRLRCPATTAFSCRSHRGSRPGNGAAGPDQVRLSEYLAAADEVLRPQHGRLSGPLAVRLDVGLPAGALLLEQRDLDNYLFPLATRLRRSTTSELVSVWGTKQYSPRSYIRVERAIPVPITGPFDCWCSVRTDTSSQTEAFKEQIRGQLAGTEPLPAGPLHMQLSFTVGPGRNWLNLWKPTIDALGQILGHASSGAPWDPLDGRIVELGLHNRVDPAIGNHVFITIAAEHLRPYLRLGGMVGGGLHSRFRSKRVAEHRENP